MALVFTIKCPKCGKLFNQPIHEDSIEETHVNCPECNYTMRVYEEDFQDNVMERMYVD